MLLDAATRGEVPELEKKALCLGCTCLHFLAIPEATLPRSTRDQVRARGAAARRKAPEVDAGLMFNFVILHALLASKQIPNTSVGSHAGHSKSSMLELQLWLRRSVLESPSMHTYM